LQPSRTTPNQRIDCAMGLPSLPPVRSLLSLSWASRRSLQYSQSVSQQCGGPTSSGDSSEAFARNGLIGHAAMRPPCPRDRTIEAEELMRRAKRDRAKRERPTAHGLIKPWDARADLPQNCSAKTLAPRSTRVNSTTVFVNSTTVFVNSTTGLQEKT